MKDILNIKEKISDQRIQNSLVRETIYDINLNKEEFQKFWNKYINNVIKDNLNIYLVTSIKQEDNKIKILTIKYPEEQYLMV